MTKRYCDICGKEIEEYSRNYVKYWWEHKSSVISGEPDNSHEIKKEYCDDCYNRIFGVLENTAPKVVKEVGNNKILSYDSCVKAISDGKINNKEKKKRKKKKKKKINADDLSWPAENPLNRVHF